MLSNNIDERLSHHYNGRKGCKLSLLHLLVTLINTKSDFVRIFLDKVEVDPNVLEKKLKRFKRKLLKTLIGDMDPSINSTYNITPLMTLTFNMDGTISTHGTFNYDLEAQLRSMPEIMGRISDKKFANNLYSSITNVDWIKDGVSYGVSLRYAGSVVSELRNTVIETHEREDYMDYYLSCEYGIVFEEIEEILNKYGWTKRIL